jgi:energy-coupling factor transporter ATP-binding protein EcfA2
MDEPTSNLDPIGKQEVFDIAAKLNRESGMTVIVIEHEVEVMARYADRIVVLDHGRIIMNGTPQEVLSRVDDLNGLSLRAPEAATLARDLAVDGLWTLPIPITTEPAVAGIRTLIGAAHD